MSEKALPPGIANMFESFTAGSLALKRLFIYRKPKPNPQLVPQVFNPAVPAIKPRKEKEAKERDKSDKKLDSTARNSKARPRYLIKKLCNNL